MANVLLRRNLPGSFPRGNVHLTETKYGNRRFSKPTYKQTIKYGKLEDMIRNKVVVRKFDHFKTFKEEAELKGKPIDLILKDLLIQEM